MNTIVQKYGGSSVKSKENLEYVCEKIVLEKDKGNNVVVIVSAQGNTTNDLISKAKEYTNNYENISKRDLDFLLSTGEMQTASLLSLMLNSKGYTSICLNGNQAGILTDSDFGNAKILDIYSKNITKHLEENKIVIITGFQGIDKLGNITTLGRGGSDLSAVAIASALNAQKCEIYSDIDGIYSADPRIIPNAKLLNEISYDEMLEAASNGAKVLHNRSVNLARKYKLKINSKCTFSNSKGSIVQSKVNEDIGVHILTKKDDISKICIVGTMMQSNPHIVPAIYKIAEEEKFPIYMISISEIAINIATDSSAAKPFMQKIHNKLVKKEE